MKTVIFNKQLNEKIIAGKKFTVSDDTASRLIKERTDVEFIATDTTCPILPSNEIPFLHIMQQKKKKESEKEKEPKKISLVLDEKYMYEQIKRGKKFYFLQYNFENGHINELEFIPDDEPIYPINDDEAVREFVKLPSGVEEYTNDENLVSIIEAHIYKYMDIPDEFRKIMAFNVIKSWVFQRFHSLNYSRVMGEPGSGKSRFLDVIGHLQYKNISLAGTATPAAVFRLADKWKGSFSIDEADFKNGDETHDMVKLINQGFEADRPIPRCDPDDVSKVQFFDPFCPKALATRRKFGDVATESRCLGFVTNPTTRKDIPSSLNDMYYAETLRIRNMLLLWRFRNYRLIDPNIGESISWDGIEPRLKQVNIGFIALFYKDKKYTAKFMEHVKAQQKALQYDRTETPEGLIVQSILTAIINLDILTPENIINRGKITDDRGVIWKSRKLSTYMKTLGFSPAALRRIDDEVRRVYSLDANHVLSLFYKFIPQEELRDQLDQLVYVLSKQPIDSIYGDFSRNVVTYVTSRNVSIEKSKEGVCNVEDLPTLREVTNVTALQNMSKVDKLLESGDLMETEPGVYRKVNQ